MAKTNWRSRNLIIVVITSVGCDNTLTRTAQSGIEATQNLNNVIESLKSELANVKTQYSEEKKALRTELENVKRQYNEEKEALRTEIESVQSQYNAEKQALSRIYSEY
jgi:predicted nuclease with TOPRIM domain